MIEYELRRLLNEDQIEPPKSLGYVKFHVTCHSKATEIIDRAKEVLIAIDHEYEKHQWHLRSYWEKVLPRWFVNAMAPEMTPTEAKNWLTWWDLLTEEEKIDDELNRQWSLLNWIYWFEPGKRNWFWNEAIERTEKSFQLFVIVDDWPFPWGSLKWLLTVAGANTVTSE